MRRCLKLFLFWRMHAILATKNNGREKLDKNWKKFIHPSNAIELAGLILTFKFKITAIWASTTHAQPMILKPR